MRFAARLVELDFTAVPRCWRYSELHIITPIFLTHGRKEGVDARRHVSPVASPSGLTWLGSRTVCGVSGCMRSCSDHGASVHFHVRALWLVAGPKKYQSSGGKAMFRNAFVFVPLRVDLSVIAMWLGHESIQTAHQYLKAGLESKKKGVGISPDAALDIVTPRGQKHRHAILGWSMIM